MIICKRPVPPDDQQQQQLPGQRKVTRMTRVTGQEAIRGRRRKRRRRRKIVADEWTGGHGRLYKRT